MPEQDQSQKTEQPTPKRLEDARQKGNIAKSKELSSVFILFSSLIIFFLYGQRFLSQLLSLMEWLLYSCGELMIEETNIASLLFQIQKKLVPILLPVMLFLAIAGILANYCQIGFLFTTEPLKPNLNKLDPVEGFQHLFSLRAFVELFKSMLKIGVIGLIAYLTIKAEFPRLPLLGDMSTGGIFFYICKISSKILFRSTLVLLIMAILDYAYQRYEWHKGLMMTKEEVKQEMKQMEGDPKIKAKIRSIQQQIARKRMINQVPQADVVITNPQHLAVAIRYEANDMSAPKVIAKGAGFLAEKIKEIAREHGIPLVEDKPLAQMLYKTLEVGQEIPPQLYQAVAEILAYVYRLRPGKYRNG